MKKTTEPKIVILYEDSNILVINKPVGLLVHTDGRKKIAVGEIDETKTEKTEQPSVAEWMLANYPESAQVGETMSGTAAGEDDEVEIPRPGIVHRLDRDTSGALLLAKTQEGFLCLKEQFQSRSIRKFYHAFVYGELKNDRGVIDRPIGRSKNDFRRWTAERGTRGEVRDAITGYSVLQRGSTPHEGLNYNVTFVEARPKTGRTHQIRVHFKAISHPLVSDALYAPQRPKLLGFERQALHARVLEFATVEGKTVRVEAPYPNDFETALSMLRN